MEPVEGRLYRADEITKRISGAVNFSSGLRLGFRPTEVLSIKISMAFQTSVFIRNVNPFIFWNKFCLTVLLLLANPEYCFTSRIHRKQTTIHFDSETTPSTEYISDIIPDLFYLLSLSIHIVIIKYIKSIS